MRGPSRSGRWLRPPRWPCPNQSPSVVSDQGPRGEPPEHRDHDQGRSSDQTPSGPYVECHRLGGVSSPVVMFPDAGQQEDVVVHGQSEEDRKQEQRNQCLDGPRFLQPEESGQEPSRTKIP
jgi:hypothetical protein